MRIGPTEVPEFGMPRTGLSRRQRAAKRLFDLTASLVLLLVLGPAILLLAAAVRLTSRGPAFFRQSRIGLHGQPFLIRKLRTMSHAHGDANVVTAAGDARVTPFGRLLRRAKLDEWPQLWNIVKGEMSFVGPRPDVPGYADRLEGEDRRVLELRPGITGPATLYFRHEEAILAAQKDPTRYNDEVVYPAKVRMNLEYMRRWTFARDIGFLLITAVPASNRRLRLIPDPAEPVAGGEQKREDE